MIVIPNSLRETMIHCMAILGDCRNYHCFLTIRRTSHDVLNQYNQTDFHDVLHQYGLASFLESKHSSFGSLSLLDASKHLYKSVHLSVRRSVGHAFFFIAEIGQKCSENMQLTQLY